MWRLEQYPISWVLSIQIWIFFCGSFFHDAFKAHTASVWLFGAPQLGRSEVKQCAGFCTWFPSTYVVNSCAKIS